MTGVVQGKQINLQESAKQAGSSEEIQSWISCYLSDLLEIDVDEIDVELPFDSYSLDSSLAIGLIGDLEDWLGQHINVTLLYNYPTIKSLSDHLSNNFTP